MELPPELTQYGGTSWTEKVMANLHEVYYQKAMPSLVMMITLTFMIGYIAMWTGLATWGPASSAVQAEWLSTVEWSLLGVFLLLLGGLFSLDFNAIGASSHAKQFVESVPDTWPQVFEGKTAQSTWLMASMWDRMYWYSQSDPRTLQNIKGWTPQTAAIFSLAQATTAMSTARGELFIAHNETATACHDSHDILDERLVAEHVITH